MAWSIAEVARMSRVTSRTLRHYDDIGLLRPAYVGSNGYRYYEREQLLRLQEILLMRELGLGLDVIGQVLDGQQHRVAALRRHEEWLRREGDRLNRLADTVARTVAHLGGEGDMTADELFDGFAERQAKLEEDLVDTHGEGVRAHFRTSRAATEGWTRADFVDAKAAGDALDARLAATMRSGAAPGSASALDAIDEHYQSICQFWTPDRASYIELGRMYVDNPDYRAHYDAVNPALAPWLRAAIAAYAEQRLG